MNHGGAEVMTMELLRNKSDATSIDFLVHRRRAEPIKEADFDAEIRERGSRIFDIQTPTSGVIRYLRSFIKLAKTVRPDVVHIHLNAKSGIVVLAAKLAAIPRIIVHSHAALTIRGSLVYRILAHAEHAMSKLMFALFATDFWGCSQEAISRLFPPWAQQYQQAQVVRNAISLHGFLRVSEDNRQTLRKSLLRTGSNLLIGNVGRVVRHKNLGFLVQVLSTLRTLGLHATLVVAGRPDDAEYLEEVLDRAKRCGVDDAIVLLGPRSDISDLMAAFDVFVSPALREGFGLVALESQAAGTPCVLSTGFPATVDVGLNLVTFIDSADPQQWARAVLRMRDTRRPQAATILHAFDASGFSAAANTREIENAYRTGHFPRPRRTLEVRP